MSELRYVLAAAAIALVPLIVGVGLGRAWRRFVSTVFRWGWVGAALIATTLPALPFVVGARLPCSIYDALVIAVALAAGIALGASSVRFAISGIAVTIVVSLVGAAALEWVARGLPDTQPGTHRLDELSFFFDADYRCKLLYPDYYEDGGPTEVRDLGPRKPGVRRVLYVGDSMTHAADVPEEQRFVHLIGAALPGEQHLNLGRFGIGVDAYYLVVDKWTPRLLPDEVVVFVFLGNDIYDMDRPLPCCDGPLLEYSASGVAPRCSVPRYYVPLERKLREGPVPYTLRVAAHYSALAKRLSTMMELAMRGTHAWSAADWASTPTQREHLVRALIAIRDDLDRRGVKLSVVLLPSRYALEQYDPADPYHGVRDEIVRASKGAGIRTFDATDVFTAALARDPKSDWFHASSHGNPHFGVAGNKLLADWLLANVVAPSAGDKQR